MLALPFTLGPVQKAESLCANRRARSLTHTHTHTRPQSRELPCICVCSGGAAADEITLPVWEKRAVEPGESDSSQVTAGSSFPKL